MAVKILMSWDIRAGRNDEYFEFIIREWVPVITRLGIQPTSAWFTVYSRDTSAPQILAECVADSLQAARVAFRSPEWMEAQQKLETYVLNYKHKVVRMRGDFQL